MFWEEREQKQKDKIVSAKSSISSNSKHEDPQENANNDYYILDSPGLGGMFCDILNFD